MKTLPLSILIAWSWPQGALAKNWQPGDPCPTAIQQTLPGGENDAFPTMRSIHAAMLMCPAIEILKVRTALLGCSDWPDRFNFPFDLQGGERYASAPLVLSLDGYEPDEREWDILQNRARLHSWYDTLAEWVLGGRAYRWLLYRRLPKQQRFKTNLDLWLDAMDFSQIHTLQLNDTQGAYVLSEQVVQKLPSRLTNLESLSVYNPIAEKFILELPKNSLKHLSWIGPWGSRENCTNDPQRSRLVTVLQHHGLSLLSLEYRTDETVRCPPPALSVDEIRQLVTLAPELRTLTIDLGREPTGTGNGLDWPWEKLQLLAEGLPALTDLTIYIEYASECARRRGPYRFIVDPWEFENDCTPHNQLARPLLDIASAAWMTRYLSKHKSGLPLKSVLFRAGDWTPPYDGPLAFSSWPLEGKRVWATCRLRESIAEENQAEISSPEIVCKAEDGHKHWIDEEDEEQYGWADVDASGQIAFKIGVVP